MGRLTFLGTGTSTGIPEIGCQCSTCISSDPRDKRLRTSAYIEYGGEHILVDCGPDVRTQLLRAGVTDIDKVLITHEHYDHCGGIDDLRPFLWKQNPCVLYVEPNVKQALITRMPYAFTQHRYPGLPEIHLEEVQPFSPIPLDDGSEVVPFRVLHGKLPIVGYRFGELAWITDCKSLPDESIQLLSGIPNLVINALRHYDHPAHLTFEESLALIEQIQPERAYLIHMAHTFGTHEEIQAICPEGVLPAYDGLQINF